MVALDLFSGAGGMSLGAIQAGISVVLAIERDPHAAKTYRANHPRTTTLNADIRTVPAEVFREVIPAGATTLIFAGPPCQGFSYSNLRTRSSENPENWLFLEFLRAVRASRPDWVVFENVQGIINTAKGLFLTEVTTRLQRLGYTVSHGLLNAMQFGVPQRRTRFFLVGSRHGVHFTMPRPTTPRPRTVRHAIADLPQLHNGASFDWLPYRCSPSSVYAKSMRGTMTKSPNHLVSRSATSILRRYAYIPPGGNWQDIPRRAMRNYKDRDRCHTGIYHRLSLGSPSVVIGNYRKNMLIHPTEHRGLSVREAARLQSMPDYYEFHGSIGFQQQQVANAVPPLLAKAVFSAILDQS